MKRTSLVLTTLAFLIVAPLYAASVNATYDHATRSWTCNNGTANLGGCSIEVNEGDVVIVSVTNTLPGLFSYEITQDPKEVIGVGNDILKKFGIPSSGGSGGGGAAKHPLVAPQAALDYTDFLAKVRALRSSLLGDFSGYESLLTQVSLARSKLVATLVNAGMPAGTMASAEVLKALQDESVAIGTSDEKFKEFWDELDDLLAKAPVRKTSGPSATFEYDDRDFDIVLTIKPLNSLIQNPEITTKAVVRLRHGWKVSTTTGFALSGLRDDHYTTTSETTGTGTNAVTVKKAVREERDQLSIPEATLFVHLYPKASNLAFSAGIGLAENASGRMYAGLSWRLGRAGALTFGVSGGKVKRLSKNINVNNLGEADPEATRRDVYKSSFMFGYSWTLTGK
jgi:hypothetical protein